MLGRLFPSALDRSEDAYDTAPFGRPFRRAAGGHLRQHPATRRTRWLWLLPLAAGVLAVVGWTVAHDPGPGLALSPRGLLTVGLAVLLAVLLAAHRRDSPGRLARALAEYAAVALLTVLLLTATPHADAAPHAAAKPPRTTARTVDLGQGCPAFKQRPLGWLTCAWGNAKQAAKPSPTTTTRRNR